MSDKIVNDSDNFKRKSLSYSKISGIISCSFFSVFTLFYLILENMSSVNLYEKILFFLLYLTLLTLCIIGTFFCCHLLYLIIYLDCSRIRLQYTQYGSMQYSDNYIVLYIIAFLLEYIVGYSTLYSTALLINSSITFLSCNKGTFLSWNLFTILNRNLSTLFSWNIVANLIRNIWQTSLGLL